MTKSAAPKPPRNGTKRFEFRVVDLHRTLRDPPDDKQPVVIPARRRRQDIDLARRKSHGRRFFQNSNQAG